jgi:periplasmic divalent cation tolerance protein
VNLSLARPTERRHGNTFVTPFETMIGWTTLPDRAAADAFARALVEKRLAACVQVSGPIDSTYLWDGRIESTSEWRVAVKFAAARESETRAWVEKHHPYDVPQWVCLRIETGSEKYLNWIVENST